MKRIFLTSCTALMTLTSCGDTNPETAGLFDNINNLNNGVYDKQIADAEAEAARISRSNAQKGSNIAALSNEKRTNNASIASLRAQIAGVQAELSSVRSSSGGDSIVNAKLNSLQGQLNAISASVGAGASSESVGRELRNVRQAIKALKS